MADWVTISSLATAGGTLVLALATFTSIRAANRSAKVSELALQGANRPLLITSRMYDQTEKIRFRDNRWIEVAGGYAYAAVVDNNIYFVVSLRNVGQGLAVLDRWSIVPETAVNTEPSDTSAYRRLTRDLYVPAGDTGLWQGAIRDTDDSQFATITHTIRDHQTIIIDIQYADQEGGQRTVSRFALTHENKDEWLVSAVRHWRLDGTNPR